MTRINTNVPSLIAQNRLGSSNADLNQALTRLSTGLRINSGADDPAGLIASEALRSEITSLGKAISNTRRASQIISTADSALGQVSSLLNDIRGLVVEAANSGALSNEEIAANQLQIDSSLEAINRIAQTTTFQGRKLLDGALDFVTSEGAGFGTVADLQIDQASLGTTGTINVNIEISSAASRATAVSTGIPASTPEVNSTGSINFSAASAADEAAGTVAFANAYVVGAEASADLLFDFASTTVGGTEATGTVDLSSGVTFDLTAVDGSAVEGTIGNNTTISVTTDNLATTSSGTYDAGTNTLNLVLEEGATGADIVTDLLADAGVNTLFTASAGSAGPTITDSGDAGLYTDKLGGATDVTSAATGFTLSAVDGGQADGTRGNTTEIVLNSGAATSAAYDLDANRITVTVAAGDTIDDVINAINTDIGGDFQASNAVNGSYSYSNDDNTAVGSPLVLGTTSAGQLTNLTTGDNDTILTDGAISLEAINGGAADGDTGNNTNLTITRGVATSAVYDAVNNQLDVVVATNATIGDIAAAITADATFNVTNVHNSTSIFDDLDQVLAPALAGLTGGTDATADDIITVTADEATPDNDGTTITLTDDNSLAAGTATASIDGSGNIQVLVSSLGPVNVGTISEAINGLDGFSAAVTATDGDGVYAILTDTPATTTALAGGVFGGGLTDDVVFQLTGANGTEVFQFEQGTSLTNIIQSINLVSDATGIEAEDDGGNLRLNSTTYGSESLVAVDVISEGTAGTFESGLSTDRANGTDVRSTVNGTAATGVGNTLSINTATLDLNITVTDGSSTSVDFSITGGGAQFQLGPDVVSNQQARLGIGSLNTAKLGGPAGRLYELASGGSKSLVNDITGASEVVNEVISKVTGLRGRLGAFQSTTLDSNLVSLNETLANLQEAESSIRDADFAKESANLTRAQILVQSGTNVLALANQNPQNVLALLR